MGLADQLASKTKLFANAGMVATTVIKGDAEVCIIWLHEMSPNPGLDVVGRLPKQFATPVKLVAFISTHATDPKASKALVGYLTSPEVEASYKKDGLLPAH